MCGIVGLVSAYNNGFTRNEVNMFQLMMFLDMLRGEDSTGVFCASNKNNVVIHKAAQNSVDFMNTKEFKKFRSDMIRDGMFAVGHNRSATRGNITDKNAHPFWENDHIVMVHNGTWKGSHKHHKDTDVDSEVIAHLLATEESVEAALRKVNAAYALAWYNVKEKSLNLIRNDERPLWYVNMDNGGIAYCSEVETLMYAAHKAELKFKGKPKELPPYIHHKYVLDQEKKEYTFEASTLDCKYKYTAHEVWQSPFPNYEGHTGYVSHQTERTNATTTHQEKDAYLGKANDVTHVFSNIIAQEEPHLAMSNDEASAIMEKMKSFRDKEIVIEITDYYHANKHPKCSAFFVFGTIVAPDDETQKLVDKVSVYWLLQNTTEEDVLKLATFKGVYTGTMSSVINVRSLDFKNNSITFLIAYVKDAKPLMLNNDTEVMSVVH